MDQTKRCKSTTDHLICPITLELPFDPVTADDGYVYERSAIEEHIARATPNPRATNQDNGDLNNLELRSPMTNEPMGPRLLPDFRTKGIIETLILDRSITGDLADAWKRRETEKKKADLLLTEAQNGDADAMFKVYVGYRHGTTNGFREDLDEALKWLKSAQSSGSIEAIAQWGLILCQGSMGTMEVEKKVSHGLVQLTVAATSGSSFGAFYLGSAYAHGVFGLDVDKTQAIAWLQKSISGECRCAKMSDSTLKVVQNLLEKLMHG